MLRSRNRIPLFLLMLLVFCGQNIALVHAIGHGYGHPADPRVASRTSSADGAPPGAGVAQPGAYPAGNPAPADDGAVCERCIHFAQLASAVAPFLPSLPTAPAVPWAAGTGSSPLLASAPPPSRSRGPPAVLL